MNNKQQHISQGTLHVWGNNSSDYHQCGVDTIGKVQEPVQVPAAQNVVAVACGDEHTIFLTCITIW